MTYTLVQPGLYVYCMVMYYILVNCLKTFDMNIIKNIDFTRTEVSCTCSGNFYPWEACFLSGDLIDCMNNVGTASHSLSRLLS